MRKRVLGWLCLCAMTACTQEAAVCTKERLAAQNGKADAQYVLGSCYYREKDFSQARIWFEKAAKQGDAWAQFSLGEMRYNGDGVPQDYAQARTWWEKAAAQADADAQFLLGEMYAKGKGVRQDFASAKVWYGKACDNGLALGCEAYRKITP